jgi:N4-gp56 family major capsid protein
MNKAKNSIFASFIRKASMKAYAAGAVTTATSTENGGVKLTDAIRMVYSKEIEFKALPVMRFAQFATIKTELGVEPGLTISMMTYANLKLGGKLTEMVDMTTQALSSSMKQITVSEHGNAVSNSRLLMESSFDDIMASTTTLLGRDYAMVLDCELRDTALSGTNIVFASKGDGTAVADRASLDATCKMKVSTIKDAIEILATNNAPKREGAYWICFVHPHQSRDLRDDSAWINASNYGAPEQLFNGEIGRIDDTRFIETTLMSNGACAVTDPAYDAELVKGAEDGSANTNVYKAVIFGDEYYGIAWSLPVELRDNGVEDFGRKQSLAWYAIWGTGILNNEYGVVIETA